MSTDVPRHIREAAVPLPMAPRRAVLQSLSTQETVPVPVSYTHLRAHET